MVSRFNTFSRLGRLYADGSDNPNPNPNPNPPPPGSGETDKKFTQDDVNKFLAEDRRKHQQNLSTLQQQLDQFKGTAKEKEALQAKLEDLQKQFLTKEELAKQEAEKARSKYENELKNTTAERDQWRNLFTNTIANTAISEAAAKNKAFNPEQIKLLLRNQVQVKQKTDENGNPIMDFDVVIPTPVKDKDGQTKVLELNVNEGVQKMRENPDFANLFLVDGTPGTGTTTINNGPVSPVAGPPSDPAAYRAWREQQKKAGRY